MGNSYPTGGRRIISNGISYEKSMDVEGRWTDMAKFIVSIDSDRCKGCELCVSVCPKQILFIQRDRANVSAYYFADIKEREKCIGCVSCARICPEGAIRIEKED